MLCAVWLQQYCCFYWNLLCPYACIKFVLCELSQKHWPWKKITWWLASSFFPQYLFLTGYECHARREGCNNWCRCETCCVLLPPFVRSCELCPQCKSSGGSLVSPGLCSSKQVCSLVLPRWVVMAGFPIGLIRGASLFYLALCSVTRAVTHVMMSYREVRYLVW